MGAKYLPSAKDQEANRDHDLDPQYGSPDVRDFHEFLHEHRYHLHHVASPHGRPYPSDLFNLWRIAVDFPGAPVPPSIHRSPATIPGEPRLLLIH